MKYSIFLSLFLLILFTACEDCSSALTSETETVISLPLETGKEFTYRFIYDDVINQISDTSDTEIIFTVNSDTLVEGITWYNLESTDNLGNTIIGGYYSNQNDGIHYQKTFEEIEAFEKVHVPGEATSLGVMLVTEYFNKSSSSNDEYFNSPFYPNPPSDPSEPTDYVIYTPSLVGSTFYKGQTITNSGSIVQNYSKFHFQWFDPYGVEYSLYPFELEYQVSSTDGILIYEAYSVVIDSNQNDPRLLPATKLRFELIK